MPDYAAKLVLYVSKGENFRASIMSTKQRLYIIMYKSKSDYCLIIFTNDDFDGLGKIRHLTE